MNRTASEIDEELEGLMQAWPTAPQELWDSLREEFAEAVVRECENRPWTPEIPADLRERINQQARPKDTNNDRPTARR